MPRCKSAACSVSRTSPASSQQRRRVVRALGSRLASWPLHRARWRLVHCSCARAAAWAMLQGGEMHAVSNLWAAVSNVWRTQAHGVSRCGEWCKNGVSRVGFSAHSRRVNGQNGGRSRADCERSDAAAMAHRFSRVNIDAADGWADKGAGPEHSVELSGRSLRSFIRAGHGGRGLGDAERGGAGGGTGANARALSGSSLVASCDDGHGWSRS